MYPSRRGAGLVVASLNEAQSSLPTKGCSTNC